MRNIKKMTETSSSEVLSILTKIKNNQADKKSQEEEQQPIQKKKKDANIELRGKPKSGRFWKSKKEK